VAADDDAALGSEPWAVPGGDDEFVRSRLLRIIVTLLLSTPRTAGSEAFRSVE